MKRRIFLLASFYLLASPPGFAESPWRLPTPTPAASATPGSVPGHQGHEHDHDHAGHDHEHREHDGHEHHHEGHEHHDHDGHDHATDTKPDGAYEKGDPIPAGHVHSEDCGHDHEVDTKNPNLTPIQGYVLKSSQAEVRGIPTALVWKSSGRLWLVALFFAGSYWLFSRPRRQLAGSGS